MNESTIRKFRSQLLDWYGRHKRSLPWRRTSDPYRILVSEVMLQQTRVDTVIGYFNRFIERFPDVRRLATASQEEVLKAWEGLGYYARGRNLHKAAQKIVSAFQGEVPKEKDTLRALPGVGEYIAAAVLSIAYNVPVPVVDGNVKRVIARLCHINTPVNDSGAMKIFLPLAETLLDTSAPGTYNQALMELGALVCLPRKPECGACPVCNLCEAKIKGVEKDYPKTKKRPKVPTHDIAAGVVKKAGKILITKRAEQGLLGGLWEFPGGKMRPGESPEDACRRELFEEVGLHVTVGDKIAVVRHAYTHFKIVLHVFHCVVASGRVKLNGPVAFKWVPQGDLSRYPFPKANLKFIPLLVDGLS